MIPAAAWALVLPGLLGSTEAGYDVGARAEVRAASPAPGDFLAGAQEIVPRIGFLLHDDEWLLSLAYYPRIYWIEPQETPAPSVMHRANLAAERKLENNRRIFGTEDFGYGLNYFSPLAGAGGVVTPAGTPPSPLQLLPGVQFANYLSSYSILGTSLELAPLWKLDAQASWVVTGGADPNAQLQIPLERGPAAQASLAYALSRLDALSTSVSGVRATFAPNLMTKTFTPGQVAEMAQATESWHTQWTRSLDMTLVAGAAVATNQFAPTAPVNQVVDPVGGIAANLKTHVADKIVTGHLSALVGPFLDIYGAAVFERAEGSVSANFNYERWDVSASLRGTVLLDGGARQGESLLTAELAASHEFDKSLKLEGGVRGYWQQGPPLDPLVTGNVLAWTLFVAFTADAKGVVGGS
ncbi:MAG TPA: hypothetical protein VH208_03170 [Myxococcaceae bacterium]|nr:hypothetical protein [Myxococcaceae bacterium]